MTVIPLPDREPVGPSVAELAAIEAEWPVIAAEVALVDAECEQLLRPSGVARARVRRAEAVLARVIAAGTSPALVPPVGWDIETETETESDSEGVA